MIDSTLEHEVAFRQNPGYGTPLSSGYAAGQHGFKANSGGLSAQENDASNKHQKRYWTESEVSI